MDHVRTVIVFALVACAAGAQDEKSPEAKQRARFARSLADSGSEAIPRLAPLLSDSDRLVRLEAVKSIAAIGTQHSIDPLIRATRDNDAEIQIRSTDGIVNFYLPGYLPSVLQRLGASIRSRFDREDSRVIDSYVKVREDAVLAIGQLARGGVSMEVRANAARAVGVLRGRAALPDLIAALQSKDDSVLFESLIAMQKIRDVSAGPKVIFLLRDLQQRVQIAAIETAAMLRAKEAVPELEKVYAQSRSDTVRRAALGALAMLGDESSRPLFQRAFAEKDEALRIAAAEGYARLKTASDRPSLQAAFESEGKMGPRLAQAFALVSLGNIQPAEFSPLTTLVNALNAKRYRSAALAYLTELAREAAVRQELYRYLKQGLRDEKTGLAAVLSTSGDRESASHLEPLTKDPDVEVAQEAIRALKNLQARLN